MRPPDHEQAAQPIRIEGDNVTGEFDNVFTQLGPNDVSYKVRTQPKMIHQYILGEVLGEGMISSFFPCFNINIFIICMEKCVYHKTYWGCYCGSGDYKYIF